MKVTKQDLAISLRAVIDEYEQLWKSEFEGQHGTPPHNSVAIDRAKQVFNSYILHRKKVK